MNVAQTNLQLYNQLREARWSDADLTTVRAAYDVSQKLFANAYRPNQKPFVCHLIGTASVLAHWGERPDMVVAGMLHSAYLYGSFGDKLGMTPEKRQYLRAIVGADIETLVHNYSSMKGVNPLTSDDRDYLVLILADLYDEMLDQGAAYAPAKPLPELCDDETVTKIIDAATRTISAEVGQQFEKAIRDLEQASPPDFLTTDATSFSRIKTGIPGFSKKRKRSRWRRLLQK
ncbi:hypothetical protein JIN77_02875 [Verrucomicrobiaceae bacterium R5-34]|uniref:DUF6817 domain-containing protein n=1 Tax=Oceaniferula flava TaxID=2800421 RepID=A0AAE2S9M2_9BACT|nr:HD domain-containing protein [Oceaniferula flavus]MBK1829656.1 hypothetical protein [Verrucomicrobiaceae bacterium R5-34]MBK1853846.1 hypothetical protein [Oceaniferula flavus]MBM1135152.1 hypothetical protein [Oceaniferula flavus]